MSSYFKDKWIEQAYEKVKLVYPNDKDSDIMIYLENVWNENFNDTPCKIYNNYEKEEIETTLSKVVDWIHDNNAITTESGSLFKQHDECFNPNTEILRSKLLERKVMKKDKFKYTRLAENATSKKEKEEYMYLADKKDLAQLRCKIIANSEYGVSGLASSWFFNMACASATTARGQALISTAMNAFEDFMSDNVKFTMMDEALLFINNIIKEKTFYDDKKWIEDISDDELVNRLISKFIDSEICDINIIKKIVKNLSQKEKNRIFYKSNLYEFIRRSRKANQLLRNIIQTNVVFKDPMNLPKQIEDDLEKLSGAVLEYVHYNYPTINRTFRLKTHKRETVIVIDTDSNFLNLAPWVDFCNELLSSQYTAIRRRKFKNNRYVISARNKLDSVEEKVTMNQNYRSIYTIIHIITLMIQQTLKVFKLRSNLIPDGEEGSYGETNMKNEFLYRTILTTPAKKHYQGLVIVQEGVEFGDGGKLDIKGKHNMLSYTVMYNLNLSNCWEFHHIWTISSEDLY